MKKIKQALHTYSTFEIISTVLLASIVISVIYLFFFANNGIYIAHF